MIAEEIIAYCGQNVNFSLRVIVVNCFDRDNMKNYKNRICCGRGGRNGGSR